MSTTNHNSSSDEALVRFTFELGQLRTVARQGWLRMYENPESVAEHTQRAACLGFLLAHREGIENPSLVATMILFHDMHETRTGDIDKIQRAYLSVDGESAARHQTEGLGNAGGAIYTMWHEVEEGESRASQIAKDAEILEMVFTARELVVRGNTDAQTWITSSRERLKTQSARELLEVINKADPFEWWKRVRQGAK